VKKGILEICDMILINKYDGNMKKQVIDEFINMYEIRWREYIGDL